jgi:hypothetical protein
MLQRVLARVTWLSSASTGLPNSSRWSKFDPLYVVMGWTNGVNLILYR